MCNILYTQAMEKYCPERPVTERLTDARAAVYWYGKATGSTGRKMGHVNALAANVSDAEVVAERVLAEVTSSHRGYRA
jgi:phosphoribosylaminoimidazole carboxylase (NCAIR synthetase)